MVGSLRVAVVGGGIGGLAAAAFLHRAGLPGVVYEQAHALEEVGAGLVLAPNAVRLLRRLGAMDRLEGRAVPLDVGWELPGATRSLVANGWIYGYDAEEEPAGPGRCRS
jgi:2-polyprenyl-6-methoxyphenol hydroxylase-like FAD-dependent oxidoreductase